MKLTGARFGGDTALSMTFDDGGVARSVDLTPEDTGVVLMKMIDLMARSGAVISTTPTSMNLKPVEGPPMKVILALGLKGWPPIGIQMSWSDLRGLSQAAWAALAYAPPSDDPSTE